MRKLALLCFSLGKFVLCLAQADSTNYQKLLSQFHQGYLYAGQNNSSNFFNQLHDATNYVLRIENPLFRTVKKQFSSYYKLEGDSLLHKISDSIYSGFAETYLWENSKADLIKWKTPLSLYNEKVCSCVSFKFKAGDSPQNLLNAFNDCANSLASDAAFTNRMQTELKNASFQDRVAISKYAPQYLYQNCSIYNVTLNNVLFGKVAENYFLSRRDLVINVKQELIRLHKENKTDSLLLVFPRFKDFEKDIKLSEDAISNADGALQDDKRSESDRTIEIKTETLYAAEPKLRITGQVTYSYKIEDDRVSVLSYKFLPYKNIPNKKKLEEELANLPPEVQIDKASPVKQ